MSMSVSLHAREAVNGQHLHLVRHQCMASEESGAARCAPLGLSSVLLELLPVFPELPHAVQIHLLPQRRIPFNATHNSAFQREHEQVERKNKVKVGRRIADIHDKGFVALRERPSAIRGAHPPSYQLTPPEASSGQMIESRHAKGGHRIPLEPCKATKICFFSKAAEPVRKSSKLLPKASGDPQARAYNLADLLSLPLQIWNGIEKQVGPVADVQQFPGSHVVLGQAEEPRGFLPRGEGIKGFEGIGAQGRIVIQ